jgi:serine/threonine protein kinase
MSEPFATAGGSIAGAHDSRHPEARDWSGTTRQLPHRGVLSQGGMGDVLLSEICGEPQIAVKSLPTEYTNDPERLRRFLQEARAASALIINIVAIYDVGGRDREYIVMEYIAGRTLRDWCGQTVSSEGLELRRTDRASIGGGACR